MHVVARRFVPRPPAIAPLGGCTRETPRCADARNYNAVLRPCCRGHLKQIVTDTVALLREHKIPFWLDYGSILGAVRNPLTTWADYPWLPQEGKPEGPLPPGIIPHDKDADFGVMAADWHKLMRVGAALTRKGYALATSRNWLTMKIRLSHRNQTNLDLFSWREKVGGTFFRPRYIQVDNYKGRDIPPGMLLPLETVEWEGMTLPAPKNPAAFCSFRYGKNWMKPVAANHDGGRRP